MPKGEKRRGQPPREQQDLEPAERERLLVMAEAFVDALKSGEIPIPERLIEDLSAAREVDPWQGLDEERMHPMPVTKREAEVLAVMSHGMKYEETAEIMGISPETVRTLAKAARRKLKAKDTKHAIATALRRGIIV